MGNTFFSYTNRDYENSRKEGIGKIPALTNYRWTDLNAGDPGVVLLDYMHALVDMCNFYMDHQALEAFLSTAKERQNLFHHAKQISYAIRSAKGALVDVNVVLDEDTGFPDSEGETITIPAGTSFYSENGYYRTLEDLIISEVDTVYEVPCQQCEVLSEIYTGTGLSDQSNNDAEDDEYGEENYENQSYKLVAPYPDIDSIEIVGLDGTYWKRVDFIALSDPEDPCYELDLNTDSSVVIKFGNGLHGKVPNLNEKLSITYLASNGADGSINGYDIDLRPSFTSNKGNNYVVYVYNEEPSTGGSSVYDVHNAPDYCANHEVKVLVLPDDATTDNSALIRVVRNHLNDRMIPPTNLYVISPIYKSINISIVARKTTYSLTEDIVGDNMRDVIDDYFDNLEMGEDFNAFNLISNLYQVKGLKSIISLTPSSVSADKVTKFNLGELDITFQ